MATELIGGGSEEAGETTCQMLWSQHQKGAHVQKKTFKIAVQTSTLLQRLWQDSTHGANASAGHKSMQALKLPPGQSPGVGVGVGAGGVGLGVGEESVVEPMGPNLMSEKITWEFACADSTSVGLPDSVEQYPRRAPGSVESPC